MNPVNVAAVTAAIVLFHSEGRLLLDGEKGALKALVADLRKANVADDEIPSIVKREAKAFRATNEARMFSAKTICTALTESGIHQRAPGAGRKSSTKTAMEKHLATVEAWAKAEGTTPFVVLKALLALVETPAKIAA